MSDDAENVVVDIPYIRSWSVSGFLLW